MRNKPTPTKLNPEQLEILRQLVVEPPDATLDELRHRLYERTNMFSGVAIVDRLVRLKLHLNFKKSPPDKKRYR